MCGIVGIVGKSDVAQRLFDGLKRLEYRGYDSAGHLHHRSTASSIAAAPRASSTISRASSRPSRCTASTGIAHTRWATHGAPTVGNAHPHIVGRVALVHNGIIENFKPLRDELIAEGRNFESETDTEVVGHLVAREIERGASPQDAVAAVLPRLHGAFAIAFLFRDHPDLIIGARLGAPLTVGYGEGENYLGSDALAVAPWTQRIAYLEEGDWAVVQPRRRSRSSIATTSRSSARSSNPAPPRRRVEKGNYRHYMQKEIFEQPIVVAQTLQTYVRPFEGEVALPVADADLEHGQSPDDRRLRHQLLRGAGRQILDRAVRARSGRHRCRERVPLSRAGARAGRARALHQPVGRDRRHARRTSPRARRSSSGSRSWSTCRPARWRARPTCCLPTHAGPGDRRRLDQGLHLPACGARGARRQPRAGQGPADPRGRAARSSRICRRRRRR